MANHGAPSAIDKAEDNRPLMSLREINSTKAIAEDGKLFARPSSPYSSVSAVCRELDPSVLGWFGPILPMGGIDIDWALTCGVSPPHSAAAARENKGVDGPVSVDDREPKVAVGGHV
jgi:hypothetical protein